MNSIDLRIIKKMEQDNHQIRRNVIRDVSIGEGLELITFLNKIKRVPMDKLNEKAKLIQRFWRRRRGETVIPYYRNMFFKNPAINSQNTQPNPHVPTDVDDIDISEIASKNSGNFAAHHNDSLLSSE
jgi:hypothetical protein